MNCWRKYKLSNISGRIQQILFNFDVSPLDQLQDDNMNHITKISEKDKGDLLGED